MAKAGKSSTRQDRRNDGPRGDRRRADHAIDRDQNSNGWGVADGGALLSYVDNSIDGNNGAEAAPPTLAKK